MKLSIRALSGLRVTGLVLLLGGVAAFGGSYALFVSQQNRYLESRNYRLLQSLAVQTEGAIRNEVRVFDSQVREFREDTWKYLRERRYAGTDLPETLTQIDKPVSRYKLVSREDGYFVDLKLSPATRGHSRQESAPAQQFSLPVAPILEPLFRPKVRQSAFDTVALATEDGEVWVATGARAEELKAARLDALLVQPAKGPPRRFSELLHTTAIDVTIGGADYKLFAQPCCRLAGNSRSMIVAGLVEASSLRAYGRAIPTTLVKLAALAVLTALVSWPFLKFAFLGGRQRVRTLDVFQIGLSSAAALGLLTITILDSYAYKRLRDRQDDHLGTLAASIGGSFEAELEAAAKQLSCLEDVTLRFEPSNGTLRGEYAIGDLLAKDIHYLPEWGQCEGTPLRAAPGLSGAGGARAPSVNWPHPFFESFSLIDKQGMQNVKLATTRWVPNRIPVRDRKYFTDLRNKSMRESSKYCPPEKTCALESLLSWTTGEPQVVLSRNASNKGYAVAALSLPLRSLTQPVLPPGFEFAVIDSTGLVVFHSDVQRNGFENFFKETDDNRRLRAQVLAHSKEALDLRYWGAPYRAYVRPLAPFGLTLVTLLQKERTWALNREWLVVSLLFLAGYLVLYGMAMLVALASGPSWVWPDPLRATRYPLVVGFNVVLLLVAVVATARWEGTSLVWCAYLIPLAAWAGTFALLRTRPVLSSAIRVSEPVRAHRSMLIALLIVSGVVPGWLLFVASFQLHIQSYLKHAHMRLARALVQREERLLNTYERSRGAQRSDLLRRIGSSPAIDPYHDLYYDFFYRTCLREGHAPLSGATHCDPDAPGDSPQSDAGDGSHDQVLGLIESFLPYYSESSVEWRELLHNRAGDRSWYSSPPRHGVLSTTLPAGDRETITLASTVPRLFGSDAGEWTAPHGEDVVEAGTAARTSAGHAGPPLASVWLGMSGTYLLVFGFALALLAMARQLVIFITKHVFLTGVTEPLWSSLKLASHAGENLFVMCDAGTKPMLVAGARPFRLGSIARATNRESALARELIRAGRADAAGTLLIDDLDENAQDTELLHLEVALLERLVADPTRVVIVLSYLSPMALGEVVRRSRKRGPAATPDRWQRLMSSFVLTDWQGAIERASQPPHDAGDRTAESTEHIDEQPLGTGAAGELLAAEGAAHPFVGQVCRRIAASAAVKRGELSSDQLLEEIGEQATPCYRRLWSSCSDDEKVVLLHIAQDGLTHSAARPIVRRLLARKLLRKSPELALMNRTFQRFVLSHGCSAEVSRLEASTGPSAWDSLRLPLGVAVVGTAVFLIATQRELYEAILGATTAAAVSVPTLVRAVGMLAGRRPATDEKVA